MECTCIDDNLILHIVIKGLAARGYGSVAIPAGKNFLCGEKKCDIARGVIIMAFIAGFKNTLNSSRDVDNVKLPCSHFYGHHL